MVYRRAVTLMEADLGEELVALDADRGTCFGFNDVAATIWRRLAEPMSFEGLHAALIDEYDVAPERCAAELGELLDQMVADGLLGVGEVLASTGAAH